MHIVGDKGGGGGRRRVGIGGGVNADNHADHDDGEADDEHERAHLHCP